MTITVFFHVCIAVLLYAYVTIISCDIIAIFYDYISSSGHAIMGGQCVRWRSPADNKYVWMWFKYNSVVCYPENIRQEQHGYVLKLL